MFSSNSTKVGGILDHERDLISLADHVKTPRIYYVAKELKVYEIVTEKSSLPFSFLHKSLGKVWRRRKNVQYRKWTSFKQGTICKAIRVAMVEVDDQLEESTLSCCLNNMFCFNFSNANKRSDIAIEFKIIENFDELIKLENSEIPERHILNAQKSFYLPVNESKLNNDIDLIPISQMAKHVSLNNLQTINNLIFNNALINNCLELKLFDENPFVNRNSSSHLKQSKHAAQSLLNNLDYLKFQNVGSSYEFLKLNQHLELDKYMSIFELTQLKLKTKILVGFSFSTQQLFFSPVEQINDNFNLNTNKFAKISPTEEASNKLISNFKTNTLQHFKSVALIETGNFNLNLNKIETFCMFNQNVTIKKNASKKPSIVNHFADLVNIDWIENSQQRCCPISPCMTSLDETIHFVADKRKISAEKLDIKNLLELTTSNIDFNSLPNRKGELRGGVNNFDKDRNQVVNKKSNRQKIYDLRANTLPSKKLIRNSELSK